MFEFTQKERHHSDGVILTNRPRSSLTNLRRKSESSFGQPMLYRNSGSSVGLLNVSFLIWYECYVVHIIWLYGPYNMIIWSIYYGPSIITQSRLASSRASLPNYSQIFDSAILEKAEDEGNGNKRVFYPSTSLSKFNLWFWNSENSSRSYGIDIW